ncbi:MAG: hypothetical protein ACI81P_001221 [Neolewinella sp.]|jgi:hypothetical protein
MRNILLLTLLCFTTTLTGQTRQDTVYNRWGQLANIKHLSKLDTEGVSRAYLFMRGLTSGDEVWQIDSISVFNAEGKYIRTRPISELDSDRKETSGTAKRRSLMPTFPEEEQRNHVNERHSIVDIVHVSGYAGTKASATINLWITGEEDLPLQLINKPENITLTGLPKALPTGSHELTVTVDMVPGVSQQTLRLSGPDKKVYDIRLALRGHDLTEEDFIPGKGPSQLKQLDATEREHLYLRLQSTEKLLNLYQEDKLRYHFPIGRQIDQIPVYHLPPGDYRMEIVDLSTGEKRSYGLKR